MSLTDLVKQQALAWASMPVSASRLLAAAADAAEAAVGVLQQMERQQAASARVLEAIEGPVVRIADAVDGAVVTQAVDALARLPAIVAQAGALSAQAQGVLSALEAPARALGPLGQKLDTRRLGELIERIDGSLSGLGRAPQESDVQLLHETTDRLTRLIDDAQTRFSLLPGAGLLLGRGHRDAALPAAVTEGALAHVVGDAAGEHPDAGQEGTRHAGAGGGDAAASARDAADAGSTPDARRSPAPRKAARPRGDKGGGTGTPSTTGRGAGSGRTSPTARRTGRTAAEGGTSSDG